MMATINDVNDDLNEINDINDTNDMNDMNDMNDVCYDENHISYFEADIRQLCVHATAQRILHIIRFPLIDHPYLQYGMTESSSDRYTVVMPGDFKRYQKSTTIICHSHHHHNHHHNHYHYYFSFYYLPFLSSSSSS